MTTTKDLTELVAKIAAEIERLDAEDTETNASGIIVLPEDDLPLGWVHLTDGTGHAYGPADEILAALQAVEYDRDATVERESDPYVCYDPECYGGTLPTEEKDLHGHTTTETVQRDNGWELAWEALAFADHSPKYARDWPEGLIQTESLKEGTANDNPNLLLILECNGGTKYAAGPDGASCCALHDWLTNVGELADTREEAIQVGCES